MTTFAGSSASFFSRYRPDVALRLEVFARDSGDRRRHLRTDKMERGDSSPHPEPARVGASLGAKRVYVGGRGDGYCPWRTRALYEVGFRPIASRLAGAGLLGVRGCSPVKGLVWCGGTSARARNAAG